MKNKPRSNIETLIIIVAAWNLSMADANAICAKSDPNFNQNVSELVSFISGKDVPLNDLILTEKQYADDAIEYYTSFKKLSQNIKYTKWKSLKKNPLIKIYGVMFDIYITNGFNTDFLNKLPFFKLTERQFAKIFIKLKHII